MNRSFAGALLWFGLTGVAFSAQAANAVESFSPQGEVKRVRQVTARFAEPMVAFGEPREVAPFDVECPVGGSGSWVDDRNWAYDFPEDLPAGVACGFTLKSGITTLSGDPLPAGQRYDFNTGGPAIRQILPYEGDEHIDENQAFLLGLDAPARPATIEEHAYCAVDGIGERIPVRVIKGEERRRILEARTDFVRQFARAITAGTARTWLAALGQPHSGSDAERFLRLRDADDSPLAVLQCRRALPPEARVKLVWAKGVESAGGIPSSQDQALPYKTRPAFQATFRCQRVNRKSQCIPILPMNLEFSAPVAFATAARIRLVGSGGRVIKPRLDRTQAIEGWVERVTFSGPFPARSSFRLEIPPELKDDAGRTLVNAGRYPLTVRTDENPPLAKFASRFGIIERGPDAALPVTLRNVEPELAAALAMPAAGAKGSVSVAGELHRADGEMEIVAWMRRLNRTERNRLRWDPGQEREVIEYHAGSESIFSKADRRERFRLAKPLGGRAFEVTGIPLKRPGFYVAELASPRLGMALLGKNRPFYVQSAALVTNLATHIKLGRENSLVWVTTLDKARPVRNAEVTVRDCGGTLYFRGRTDADGIARIDRPLPARDTLPDCLDKFDRQYFVTARSGDDLSFAFSGWNEGIAPWRFGVPTGSWEGPYVAHAVLDRTLLRAGETVHMKLFLRRRTGAGFAVPATADVGDKVVVRHAGTGKDTELAVKWEEGVAEGSWAIPRDAKQGAYEILVRDFLQQQAHRRPPGGNLRRAGSFRVEPFRVPTMKATLKGSEAPLVSADEATVEVQLSYLAGGAARHAPVKLRSLPQQKVVQFADYDDFVFGNGDVREGVDTEQPWSWRFAGEDSDGEDAEESAAVPMGIEARPASTRSLTLDANGAARVTLANLPKSDKPQDLQVELEYRDANGETLTSSMRLGLWPAKVIVGIKPDSWVASEEHVRFQTLALDLSGKPAAGVKVKVDLLLREHYSHRRRLLGGFYAYEHSSEVKRLGEGCEGTTDAKGLLSCDIASPRSGNLILRARATDADGHDSIANREVWVASGEDWWFDVADNDRMDLLPERKRYEPGETARFQVRMPFPRATVLVTVEREGVIDSFVREVARDDPVIEVPVKGGYAPNVFVTALAVRGRVAGVQPTALVDLGKPAFKMGVAEINVGWRAHELKVTVEPDRSVYKVREVAKVRVDVRRADGARPPPGSEIALAAVDEGLLELLPNDSWKLLEAMMTRRGLEVETATAQMQVVGKRHFGRKALPAGGGGGRQSARELFDTLLFWKAAIKLDGNGTARAEVPLNDSLTRFRIVAVASGGDLFGTGFTTVRSTQDLMLLSGVPPVARSGDRLRASFTVRNASERALEVGIAPTMSLRLGGKTVKTNALPVQTVKLEAGAAQELGWDITAPEQAQALDWEVKARAKGSATDDVLRVSQKIVPAVAATIVQSTIARIERPLDLAVRPPEGALPGRGGVRVRFQNRLAGDLSGVREYMDRYPYTCIEQRASKAVALRDGEGWRQLTADLGSYLDRDGLVKYFPSMVDGSDTLTAYLLAIAHEAGWALPDADRARMQRGLVGTIEGSIHRGSALPTADLTLRRLAAIDALSRYGLAVQSQWLDSLSIEPNLWPTSALLDWYGILRREAGLPERNDRLKQAEQILRSRLDFRGTTMGFSTERGDALWWLMVSGDVVANRALLTLLDDERWREDIPRMVRGALGRQQGGHWNTTTANAWGVLALEKYSARFESEPVAGAALATLGGATFEHRWSADGKAVGGLDIGERLLPWPSGSVVLAVRQEGIGQPWLTLQSVAAIPITQARFNGYRIARSVTALEQKIKGRWSRGDVARVRLDMEAQTDMTWVVVSDPVPAGSQILGGGLGNDPSILGRGEKKRSVVRPAFQERTFEAFRAYYPFVPKGQWSIEYSVRFNGAGEFQLPETRVEAMYAPEVFGAAPNEAVVVKP